MYRPCLIRLLAAGAVALVGTATAAAIAPGTAAAVAGLRLSIFAGTGMASPPMPGPAALSALNTPNGIAFDSSGNVYIVDSNNNEVEKVTLSGNLSIFAGTGVAGAATPGPATASALNGPGAITIDRSDNAYIADSGNNVVEKVTPSGTLSIFAGKGTAGAPTPGPARSSALNSLNQVAVDPSGSVYIADSGNSVVEKVTPSGTLSIVAGTGRAGTPTPGPARSSALNYPGGVAVDSSGDIYIADFGNNVVEKVTLSGTLSIFAGRGMAGTPTPGPAISSALGGPAFVAIDSAGTVYIADFGANVVEKVTPSGNLSILAGKGTPGTPTPGPATSSALDGPVGVAVDSWGNVYIGDSKNNLVEKVILPAPTIPTITNLPASGTVGGAFTTTVATSGDGMVTVTSNSAEVCTVNGLSVAFVGPGTCSLTASVGIGASYGAASGIQMFAVTAPCSGGYRIVGADGAVHSFGSGGDLGSLVTLGVRPTKPIVGGGATADCKGYWLVAGDGGIFAFGDAWFSGSMGGQHLNQPIVGMVSNHQGGYYEVASDGGIFSFGNAAFYGSMGGRPLNSPVVGVAATPDGHGYWEVAADGGVFSFGNAVFYGSMGGRPLNSPVVGVAATPDGRGYWEVAADGGVFSFGDASFNGSASGLAFNGPAVGLLATSNGDGYWIVGFDGGLYARNAPISGNLAGLGITDVVGLVG